MNKKSDRVIYTALVLILMSYIGWSCRPRTVDVEWHDRISADDRAAAEDYLSKHPLTPSPMTWEHVWHNIFHPYNAIEDSAVVTLMEYSDGKKFIQIDGPRENLSLRRLEGRLWEVIDPAAVTDEGANPFIGRMFEKRTK